MEQENGFDVKKNIIWNSVGNLTYWGCQWLITILVVRVGGYVDAGILAIAMSLSSTIYCISSYGVYNYQVSDLQNAFSSNCYMTARKITVLLGVVICFITCILQKYDAYSFKCVMFYMVYKSIEALVNVIQAEEQRYARMDLIGKAYIIRGVGTLGLFVGGLAITRNLMWTIIFMCIYSMAVYVFFDLCNIVKLKGEKYTYEWGRVIPLLVTCLPMALYWLFNTLTPTIPKMVIKDYLGDEMLGYYASISSPLLIITMATNFVLTPLISILSRHYIMNLFDDFKKMIIRILLSIMVAGIVCYLVALKVASFFYQILYGQAILEYMNVSYFMIVVVVLATVISFLNILYTVFRKLWYLVFLNGIASLASLLCCEYFVPRMGMQGANLSLLVVYSIQIVIMIILMMRFYKTWKENG